MTPGRMTLGLLCAALVTAPALAPAVADSEQPKQGTSSVPKPRGPAPGDRNGDRVSDDLERRLAAAPDEQRLDVIVTGLGASAARRSVGAFRLNRALPVIDGFAATVSARQARGLSRVPGVRRVEPDRTVHALDDATNRDFGVDAARGDRPGLDGSGVTLCVVDTGIDPAHEQVAPRSVVFKDFVNDRAAPYDDHGHGTHVAAIAAGDGTGGAAASAYVGVAPAADLAVAKVLNAAGTGSDSQVIAGIQWCATTAGADVISMSLGDPAGGDGTDASSLAVDNAVAAGVTVVVAAGNAGDAPRSINYPGTARGAITVGAVSDWSAPVGTDRHDDGTYLATFSSRGPTTDQRTKPDISAPGVTVRSAQAGSPSAYVTQSGTSMATPYVAGAAVLGLEAAPAATPAEVKQALMASAVDTGQAGTDNQWGAGLVDVRAFVDTLAGAAVRRTDMQVHTRLVSSVADNGQASWTIPVSAAAVGAPLSATMNIYGSTSGTCFPGLGCFYDDWSPDLDMELRNPSGTVVASSRCTLSGMQCGTGHQETIGHRPAVAGDYVLRVWADTGSPNNGKGGSFALDIFSGPVGTTSPPPPQNLAPVANAGPDRRYKRNRKSQTATFTLDGTASSDPEGQPLSYRWSLAGTQVGSSATLSQTKPLGSYTYTLTVTDPGGLSSSDTVSVTVTR